MAAPESDVTALVLSVGEPTTDRAIASVERQTVMPREIIVIRDLRPFHRALNAGAVKVRTPYFVQVDADMILDPTCIGRLWAEMNDDAGIVVGHLRDELIGDVVGIKMFRTRCFEALGFRNSISPDTDFGKDIAEAGWKTVYAGAPAERDSEDWAMFGDHRPDYTIEYTYKKYLLEGRRYRYRDRIGGIRWHFGRLETSRHPAALAAQIALARGIFLALEDDQLGTLRIDRELEMLRAFTTTSEPPEASHLKLPRDASPADLFRLRYRIGNELFHAANFATFRRVVSELRTRRDERGWFAKVALCQGLFSQAPNEAQIRADWQLLHDFMHLPEIA